MTGVAESWFDIAHDIADYIPDSATTTVEPLCDQANVEQQASEWAPLWQYNLAYKQPQFAISDDMFLDLAEDIIVESTMSLDAMILQGGATPNSALFGDLPRELYDHVSPALSQISEANDEDPDWLETSVRMRL